MRIFLIGALASLLVACGSDDQGELDDAKALWKTEGFEAYELYAEDCSWGECTGEVHVVVTADGVTAERTRPLEPDDVGIDAEDFRVEAYFAYVQRAIDRGDLASVHYDDERGFVGMVALDSESTGVLLAYNLHPL